MYDVRRGLLRVIIISPLGEILGMPEDGGEQTEGCRLRGADHTVAVIARDGYLVSTHAFDRAAASVRDSFGLDLNSTNTTSTGIIDRALRLELGFDQ